MKNNITGAIIQARLGSTRLKGKTVRLLHRDPLISHVIKRTKAAKLVDKVVLATSFTTLDKVLVDIAIDEDCAIFRGEENDVLNRYIQAARIHGISNIVRVTGDNPLISYQHIDLMVAQFLAEELEYSWVEGLPLGLGCEIVKAEILERIDKGELEDYHREHVTIYIRQHLDQFRTKPLIAEEKYRRPYRLTVDTLEDFRLIEHLHTKLSIPGKLIDIIEVLQYLDKNPRLAKLNEHIIQKEK